MTASSPGPLVSQAWLEEHLDDPTVVVVEVPFHPPGSPASTPGGHVPGAQVHWWKELCWHQTDRLFPTAAAMARRLEDLGVSDGTTLALVGDPLQFATYAYWVLTLTGLEHLAVVVDGGRPTWLAEGRPTVEEPSPPVGRGRVTVGEEDHSSRVGRDEILDGLGRPDRVLVDLRSDEEYRGDRVSPVTAPYDHGAERAGHIPGARHLPRDRLLDDSGRFLPAAEIRARLESVGAEEGLDVVTYCRLSHRASLGWFAATRLAGLEGVRVYDGSWTEWGSIVGVPIER
jgi:thiosulfate/3-mercaptopyruvate sulfurtransferase